MRGEGAFCPVDGQSLEEVADPLLGCTVAGRYVVEEKLGEGGMGSVYRGRHQVIERQVAIKFLHRQLTTDARQRKRFLGEARAANQINHEHIIDITDFGETDDGLVYLVMEYLDGRSLAHDIARLKQLPVRQVIEVAIQVSLGLARAHELDVIHRDVKPANIFLLQRRGNPDFVKLLDFGIAHFEKELRITDRGSLVGTPEYMSPELLKQGQAGVASDLYAVGCVMFEMLMGTPPFTGPMSTVMVKQMTASAPLIATKRHDVPTHLDDLVHKLLQKNPELRHRDAFHLVQELEQLLKELPAPQKPAAVASPERPTFDPSVKPTLYAPPEDEWQDRVRMYRELIGTTYKDSTPPPELSAALQTMDRLVSQLRSLRDALNKAARSATEHEDAIRGLRLRICHALDELARDDSRLAGELEGQKVALERAQARLEGAFSALDRGVLGLPKVPVMEQALNPSDHQAVAELLHSASRVRESRQRVAQIGKTMQDMSAQREDLRFQMGQLKGRLGSVNATSSQEAQDSHVETGRLDTQMRQCVEQIIAQAEQVAGHLRERGHGSRAPDARSARRK
jgi:serine/threonine protein kinase